MVFLVIRSVKSGPFENNSGALSDKTFYRAVAFWTLFYGSCGHGLESFKNISAFRAFILVCWHDPLLFKHLSDFVNKTFFRGRFFPKSARKLFQNSCLLFRKTLGYIYTKPDHLVTAAGAGH